MDYREVLKAQTVLDRKYRIDRVIGAGGFGITYQAFDLGLAAPVAIKEYYPAQFGMRDSTLSIRARTVGDRPLFDRLRASFLREARTLAQFDHPAIVRVLSVFETHGTAYMVMRFESGPSLKVWLKSLDRVPLQHELDRLAGPLLDAIELMHKSDFLHRDIAPDNIIVRADGTPVLLDFGASRRVITDMSGTLTGVVKQGYSPQEQYSSDVRAQGPWTDIYSLGATFYLAVTGRVPTEATARMLDDGMTPASDGAQGDYRPEFLAAIDSAMRLRPRDRPQSVAEWRAMLFEDADTTWFHEGRDGFSGAATQPGGLRVSQSSPRSGSSDQSMPRGQSLPRVSSPRHPDRTSPPSAPRSAPSAGGASDTSARHNQLTPVPFATRAADFALSTRGAIILGVGAILLGGSMLLAFENPDRRQPLPPLAELSAAGTGARPVDNRAEAELARLELEQKAALRLREAEARRQEAARQAEILRQQEEARKAAEAEARRQEAARQAEIARQQEEARQAAEAEARRQEAARQTEIARQREDARKAAEAEARRQEAARQAEIARQQEEARQAAEAEARRQEAARQAAIARQQEEARKAAEAEARRQEAARQAEITRQQEEARQAAEAEARRQEAARQAEIARQREEVRKAAEAEARRQEAVRQAEIARQREEARQAAEAEARRQEAARQAEIARQQEEARKAAEAETRRQEVARQAEIVRQQEEARKAAEAQAEAAARQRVASAAAAIAAEEARRVREAEALRLHAPIATDVPATSIAFADPTREPAQFAQRLIPMKTGILAAGTNGRLRFWTPGSTVLIDFPATDEAAITSLSLSADGDRLATGSRDGTLRIWDVHQKAVLHTVHGSGSPVIAVRYRSEKRVVALHADGKWIIIEPGSGDVLLSGMKSGVASVTAAQFSEDGKIVFAALAENPDGNVIESWVPSDGSITRVSGRFVGHTGRINAVAASANGEMIASASEDGTVRLWKVDGHQELRRLAPSGTGVRALSFSATGAYVAGAGADGTVDVWQTSDGKRVASYRGTTRALQAAIFSSDGASVVASGEDGMIRQWLLPAGLVIAPPTEATKPQPALAVLPKPHIERPNREEKSEPRRHRPKREAQPERRRVRERREAAPHRRAPSGGGGGGRGVTVRVPSF